MKYARLMSSTIVACILLLPGSVAADPPIGYYATVDTSASQALRASLHDIIDDHTYYPYTDSATDTWNVINEADQDPVDAAKVLVVYKNASYDKIAGGTGAYNREHSWPNSYGFTNDDDNPPNYPYTDCHHLMASDTSYNSARGSRLYDNCDTCAEYTTVSNHGEGGGSGVYPGNSNWRTTTDGAYGSWETWIGRRGDVARAMFYMDVRYEGGTHGITGTAEPDLILTDNRADIETPGYNASVGYMGLLSVLLEWHIQDPPNDAEMLRNDVVASYQGNRNPFVDHPEWAECIFVGTSCGNIFSNGFESGDTSLWSSVIP